jgi:hypothetical protein
MQVQSARALAEVRMLELVTGSAIPLLDSAPPDLWQRLQQLLSSSAAEGARIARQHLKANPPETRALIPAPCPW